jgi:hypothetical protein
MRRFHPKLTYANVMATIAVFIALGGSGYAALRIPRNSVGSRQLQRHAVTNSKIAPGAVSASRVKPNTLAGAEINEAGLGQVPSAARADHAGSADSAATAADAATLNGVTASQLKLSCPAGTLRYLGECFETAERAATDWGTALIKCTGAGGRLPSVAELADITRDTPIQFGGSEWTSDFADPNTVITVADGATSQAVTSISVSYRCVFPTSN